MIGCVLSLEGVFLGRGICNKEVDEIRFPRVPDYVVAPLCIRYAACLVGVKKTMQLHYTKHMVAVPVPPLPLPRVCLWRITSLHKY